jgi:hypothetical protein
MTILNFTKFLEVVWMVLKHFCKLYGINRKNRKRKWKEIKKIEKRPHWTIPAQISFRPSPLTPWIPNRYAPTPPPRWHVGPACQALSLPSHWPTGPTRHLPPLASSPARAQRPCQPSIWRNPIPFRMPPRAYKVPYPSSLASLFLPR